MQREHLVGQADAVRAAHLAGRQQADLGTSLQADHLGRERPRPGTAPILRQHLVALPQAVGAQNAEDGALLQLHEAALAEAEPAPVARHDALLGGRQRRDRHRLRPTGSLILREVDELRLEAQAPDAAGFACQAEDQAAVAQLGQGRHQGVVHAGVFRSLPRRARVEAAVEQVYPAMLAVGRAQAVVHHHQELAVVQAQQAWAVHRRPDALGIGDPRPRLLVAGDRLLAEPRARFLEQLGAHHALVDDPAAAASSGRRRGCGGRPGARTETARETCTPGTRTPASRRRTAPSPESTRTDRRCGKLSSEPCVYTTTLAPPLPPVTRYTGCRTVAAPPLDRVHRHVPGARGYRTELPRDADGADGPRVVGRDVQHAGEQPVLLTLRLRRLGFQLTKIPAAGAGPTAVPSRKRPTRRRRRRRRRSDR